MLKGIIQPQEILGALPDMTELEPLLWSNANIQTVNPTKVVGRVVEGGLSLECEPMADLVVNIGGQWYQLVGKNYVPVKIDGYVLLGELELRLNSVNLGFVPPEYISVVGVIVPRSTADRPSYMHYFQIISFVDGEWVYSSTDVNGHPEDRPVEDMVLSWAYLPDVDADFKPNHTRNSVISIPIS
jgi:hypothetical protein